MAIFVHFTDENNKNSIVKNGLRVEKIHYEDINKGIFCMPVIPDFYATYQWLREIKQYNSGNEITAVYFKIPDDETVFCGKYNEKIIRTTAVEAHNTFINLEDKMGFQVIIIGKIFPNEITKIKNISQIIGWRHFPKSHEIKRCLCPACLTKGSYNSLNVKKRKLKELLKKIRSAKESYVIKGILCDINELRIKDKTGTEDEKMLLNLLETNDEILKISIINCMSVLYGGYYRDYYFQMIYNDESNDITETCIRALLRIYGDEILNEIKTEKCSSETIKVLNEYRDE